MRQDLRDKEGLTGRIGLEKACEGVDRVSAAKRLGRMVALAMVLFASLVVAVGLTSCVDDDNDGPETDWYFSGVWQNNEYLDEVMVFYSDGTGYWESVSTGAYLDFDYYCYGNWVYFTFYPVESAPYTLDCYIDLINDGNMSITWPAGSFYGATTIYYTRID